MTTFAPRVAFELSSTADLRAFDNDKMNDGDGEGDITHSSFLGLSHTLGRRGGAHDAGRPEKRASVIAEVKYIGNIADQKYGEQGHYITHELLPDDSILEYDPIAQPTMRIIGSAEAAAKGEPVIVILDIHHHGTDRPTAGNCQNGFDCGGNR